MQKDLQRNNRLPVDRNKISKILIRGLNWRLGDSLMTTPFLSALSYLFPNALIDIIVPKRTKRIFEGNPNINKIIKYDTHMEHRSIYKRIKFGLSLRKHNYDIVFLLQRAIEASIIARLAGIPLIMGYDSDHRKYLLTHPVSENGWSLTEANFHQVDYYLNILKTYFDLKSRTFNLTIYPLEKDLISLHDKLKIYNINMEDDYIIVSPGTSYGSAKLWDIDRWISLIKIVLEEHNNLKVFMVGAEHDIEYCNKIKIEHNNFINLCGKTNLGELIQLLHNSKLVITIDNGNSHLATALNRPLIALFGSTNPITTGPYNRTEDIIYKKVYCSPCCDIRCKELHHLCMKNISVNKVYNEILLRI